MILRDLLQLVLFIGLLAALSPLLGRYVHQVFSGPPHLPASCPGAGGAGRVLAVRHSSR